ncbi:MAG: methylenetetrahydrofolate reductase [NAD(P)H] [Phycisphaerales bacterium]|nr:MAG: methylenetetrahydrofolate reductase [NAD(P)H] [Phycisphaerales bacterium]
MKIREQLQQRATLSFEFFPPRDDIGFWDLYRTIEKLKPLAPSFVSVTYGAGGVTRRKTVDLVARIKSDIRIEGLAHLTCVGASRREIADVVDELKNRGLENILALRGDPPQGQREFEQPENGFAHADALVTFIKDRHDFCLGGACHPEMHPEAPSPETDLDNLKRKVDAGCDFLITQLFFDNERFYRFRDRAVAKGIRVPIIAGIMPILSVAQTKRFTDMCGATIPRELLDKIEAVEDDVDAVRQVGMYHATEQCCDLLEHQAAGIHFYTLNRSTATRAIYQQIKARVDKPVASDPQ